MPGPTLALLIAALLAAEGPFEGPYRLKVGRPRPVRATLSQSFAMPGVSVGEWWVVAADPPSHDGQSASDAEIRVEGTPGAETGRIREGGPRHQPILSAHWFANTPEARSTARVVASYQLSLIPRTLVPGEPEAPVPPLPPAERAASLRSAGLIDHGDKVFKRWLDDQGLTREAGERDLNFAYRALEAIAGSHSYRWVANANPRPSIVCKRGWGECGALSYLFVATLRAGKIPARALAGRWAKSSAPGRDFDSGSFHVKAEFWAEGIGWVPVEVSGAVSSRGRGLRRHFGDDPGDLLTFHFDSVVVQNRATLLQQGAVTIADAVGFGRLRQTDQLRVEFLDANPD